MSDNKKYFYTSYVIQNEYETRFGYVVTSTDGYATLVMLKKFIIQLDNLDENVYDDIVILSNAEITREHFEALVRSS